jgi:transposase
LDAEKLLNMLIRYHNGERHVWSVVHVPSVDAEDMRHLHRELIVLKSQKTRHSNRIQGLLMTQGIRLAPTKVFLEHLNKERMWNGSPLPPGIVQRVEREYRCWQFVHEQIRELEAERRKLIRDSEAPSVQQVRQLLMLRGIGENSAWLFVMEFFAWREFNNRREVGALAGLTPTPYASGDQSREQGISKSGNRLIRAMAIEIAWQWIRHQPDSALSLWYQERFANSGKRLRKVGIVAVARKLLVSLWQFLETGAIPEGAQLRA